MRLWYQFDHSRDIVFPKSVAHATHPSPWSTDDTPLAFYAEGENSLVTTKIISFSESVVLQKKKQVHLHVEGLPCFTGEGCMQQ